ncbi:hypothetical protein HNV08_11020 [Winogradskyella eckloniae]|uniref:hypothetical protein n=1 Tax=Winogradskyella eckloniae TaxID=1089306 RepID=UPI0015640E73|nr:hypothetical protein [Winogradskyella eckloniae]NRD20580.1 hypothetical protein [Winogradskyella eckloniae]
MMSRNLKVLFLILLYGVVLGCAQEELNSYEPEDTNAFTYNGATYPLMAAIVLDEETSANTASDIKISLFNKSSAEITSNSDVTDLSYVSFEVVDIDLNQTTYNQIDDYTVSINGSVTDSEFHPGTILLSSSDADSHLFAQSGVVTITNYTAYNIVFTFSFTRTDGTLISGSYDGNYLLSGN